MTSQKEQMTHSWHNVTAEDQARIRCQKGNCLHSASICEHSGLSFLYFCEEHGSGLREALPEYKVRPALRFFWNGIKASDGKLQKCSYCDAQLRNSPAGTLTIYKRDYRSFSADVREWFLVDNDSDGMTDYFEQDSIRVLPNHPLHTDIQSALAKQRAHNDKRCQRRGL